MPKNVGVRVVAVVAIGLLLALPIAVFGQDRFLDVYYGDFYHSDVNLIANRGIITGCNPPSTSTKGL